MNRIFVSKKFDKEVKKLSFTDKTLMDFVETAHSWDDLGSFLFKARMGLDNQGKRGSARVIISAKVGDKYFYLHSYKKGKKETLTKEDERQFKIVSKILHNLKDDQLMKLVESGEMREVKK
mgnify:CR=1 FL=1|tara:strand:- start:1185 stop:1547 length:363 start_codon:yes stop_codon:yes gene_type:complete